MINIKDIVKHLLQIDRRTRGNDTLLQFKIIERLGFARYMDHTRYGNGWFIRENDILNGKISSSIMETIRRSRQKIQENGQLLPTDTILEERMKSQEKMRMISTLDFNQQNLFNGKDEKNGFRSK